MMYSEKWHDIAGYEGHYQVSNTGKVKSIKFNKELLMSTNTNRYGYKYVNLYKDGVAETKTIHRLVAETFISNPGNKPQVNHIDSNRSNNFVENLEWCTRSENMLHSYRNTDRQRNRGEKCPTSKLTKDDVMEIRYIYENNPDITQAKLGERYGVSQGQIWRIINNKRWSHI